MFFQWIFLAFFFFLINPILFNLMSMKLSVTVTYSGLEQVSFCWSIPMLSAFAQCLWWDRWIRIEHESCLPWGVLAVITWVGDVVRGGKAKVRAR